MAGPPMIPTMKPLYLNVALPVPLRSTFHYLPPSGEDTSACPIGARIKVPFGRQTLIGIITGYSHESEFAEKIKPALELLDSHQILDPDIYSLCTWAAEYYHHPLGEVLQTALPVLLRQGRAADGKITKL